MILAANDKLLAWGVVFFLYLGSPLMKGIVFCLGGTPFKNPKAPGPREQIYHLFIEHFHLQLRSKGLLVMAGDSTSYQP